MMYRKDIDGLRAFAVIYVVFYHFFPIHFSLGYLGVDVFFVISGYLITLHLIGKDNDVFFTSLYLFYSRRIKRLFPALFVFLFIATILVCYFFLNSDLQSYFYSLISAKTFWANIYFWRDGGYFGGNDQLKPLLHIWSLSVEEQFYIFYPAFIFALFLISKNIKNVVLLGIVFVTSLSFLLWLYLYSIGGSNPAFFLMPSRAWQFGLGAIFAFIHFHNYLRLLLSNIIISYISIFLFIVGFLFSFNQLVNTIIVTLGATSLIASLNKDNLAFKFLTSRLFVFLGNISYSVYLYHWIIAVLLLYVFVDAPSIFLSFLGILLSFFIGWLSYKYVEIPFRFKYSLKYTLLLMSLLTAISMLILLLVINFGGKDNISKLAENSNTNYRCPIFNYIPYGTSRACKIGSLNGPRNIVLLGNSHAQMYTPIVDEILLNNNQSGYLVPLNGCLPTVNINISNECFHMAQENLDAVISDEKIKKVILASTWYDQTFIDKNKGVVGLEELTASFVLLIEKLKKHGKDVALISPIQIPSKDLAGTVPRLIKFGFMDENNLQNYLKFPRQMYDDRFSIANKTFQNILFDNYIQAYLDLCDKDYCYFGNGYVIYFADLGHLSENVLNNLNITHAQLQVFIER